MGIKWLQRVVASASLSFSWMILFSLHAVSYNNRIIIQAAHRAAGPDDDSLDRSISKSKFPTNYHRLD